MRNGQVGPATAARCEWLEPNCACPEREAHAIDPRARDRAPPPWWPLGLIALRSAPIFSARRSGRGPVAMHRSASLPTRSPIASGGLMRCST